MGFCAVRSGPSQAQDEASAGKGPAQLGCNCAELVVLSEGLQVTLGGGAGGGALDTVGAPGGPGLSAPPGTPS